MRTRSPRTWGVSPPGSPTIGTAGEGSRGSGGFKGSSEKVQGSGLRGTSPAVRGGALPAGVTRHPSEVSR